MDMQIVKQSRADVETMLLDVIPHLRAFARSLTRNRDQADDLTHDAVVRALAAIDQFTPGTNFKAWMFTILRNLYYNECRKRWIKSTPIDEMAGDEPSIATGAGSQSGVQRFPPRVLAAECRSTRSADPGWCQRLLL